MTKAMACTIAIDRAKGAARIIREPLPLLLREVLCDAATRSQRLEPQCQYGVVNLQGR